MKESSKKDLNVEFMCLDLGSIQSTKDFVRAFKDKNLPLHILINNAAVAMVPYSKSIIVTTVPNINALLIISFTYLFLQ